MFIKPTKVIGIHKLFEKNDDAVVLKEEKRENYSNRIIFCTCKDDLELGDMFTDGKQMIWAQGDWYLFDELNKNTKQQDNSTEIPTLYFDGTLPTSKADGLFKSSCHYISNDNSYSCYATLKVQGNSSASYPKKNFSISFFSDEECTVPQSIDFGWGAQYKYCIKANYIDITHSRNIVSANLWSEIVTKRENIPSNLEKSPNNGAVDGFPILFFADNVYWGRYTLNIPKNAWMANMSSDNMDNVILSGEDYVSGCFQASPLINGEDWSDEVHSECPSNIKSAWVDAVNFVLNNDGEDFKNGLSEHFDVQSLIDYYVFGLVICHLDGFGKNQLYLKYDNTKFFASVYDLDSTFGLYWDGRSIVPSSYPRQSYEDFKNGRSGNKLYIKLADNFQEEIIQRFIELTSVNGTLSYYNVITKFTNFISIIPHTIVEEDYANTTGNGKCTDIPSVSTNNIQQIRSWYGARLKWLRLYFGLDMGPEIPQPTEQYINYQFDGAKSKRTPYDTGLTLFDTSGTYDNWTLFCHVLLAEPQAYQSTGIHCMDESGNPWPGICIQTQNVGGQLTADLNTSSVNNLGMYSNDLAVAFKREGNTLKYSTDGYSWHTMNTSIVNHTSSLILGGYRASNGFVGNGEQGREILGYVTVKYWNESLDNISSVFYDHFPELEYDFMHDLRRLTIEDFNSMVENQTYNCVLVNPNKNKGCILGVDDNGFTTIGFTQKLSNVDQTVDKNIDNTIYQFEIKKIKEFNSFGFAYEHISTETNVFTMQTTIAPQNGMSAYSRSLSYNTSASDQTFTITLNNIDDDFDFEKHRPTIYLLGLSTVNRTVTITDNKGFSLSKSSTNNANTNLANYTPYVMTSKSQTFTVNITAGNWITANGNASVYVAFYNENKAYTGNEYVTIKSVNANKYINEFNGEIILEDNSFAEFEIVQASDSYIYSNLVSGIETTDSNELLQIDFNNGANHLVSNNNTISVSGNISEQSVWLAYVSEGVIE